MFEILVYVGAAAAYFTSGSVSKVWLIYFPLQYISFLRVYELKFPAIAEIFLQHLNACVEFEIINPLIWARWANPQFDLRKLSVGDVNIVNRDQLTSLIADWNFFIEVMALTIAVYILLKLLALICFWNRHNIFSRLLMRLKSNLFYNWTILFLLITYIKVTESFGQQIGMLITTSAFRNSTETIVGCVLVFFMCCTPYMITVVLIRVRNFLINPNITRQIGIITKDLNW